LRNTFSSVVAAPDFCVPYPFPHSSCLSSSPWNAHLEAENSALRAFFGANFRSHPRSQFGHQHTCLQGIARGLHYFWASIG
jgi:hypothetical protein